MILCRKDLNHPPTAVGGISEFSPQSRGSAWILLAVRESLSRRRSEGKVAKIVFGEQWTIFDATANELLRIYPALSRDSDLERNYHFSGGMMLNSGMNREIERSRCVTVPAGSF